MTEEKQPLDVVKGEVTGEQTKEIEAGDFLSIKNVATRLNFTSAWITMLCQRGDIKAVKIGRAWRIPKSEWVRLSTIGAPMLPRQPKKPPVTTLEMSEKQETRIRGKEKEAKKKESWFPLDFSGLFGGKDE